jgi:hypothetical protein
VDSGEHDEKFRQAMDASGRDEDARGRGVVNLFRLDRRLSVADDSAGRRSVERIVLAWPARRPKL